ncbi:hypothetical protein BUALT_Bualt08G0088500 [Buddleja alternifolia]|uniref:HTH La-type RNA-binding domain-containing protein n=1 Tax=Buddleja alternifolia TaxID=168488 RepID=A0AAV6XFU1_9LAMI|nr:hypothetical protein BUALT_Bualt08G0088500 [Buddleja alternifolia]
MVTDYSPHSPTAAAAAASNGGVNSPQSQRRNLPSPWASVVRGDSDQTSAPAVAPPGALLSPPPEEASVPDNAVIDSSGAEAQPESSDVSDDSNAGRPRRPAWNTPLNGVVEAGSVMGGAVSWPALSESTRPGPRTSLDSPRPVSDGSASSSQAPVTSQPPQRQANTNAHSHSHANSTASNTVSTRPRSRNRGGGSSSGSVASYNSFNRPSPATPPPFPVVEVPYGIVPPILDTPMRGTRPVGGVGGSHSHTGNDHSSQRNNSRRNNYGPRPRGDGQYHNNHGGRRDQDRRDVHIPPPYVPPPMGYIPPPLHPGAPPFMNPHMRVFPGPMGIEMPPFFYLPTMPPESYRPMPMVPPQPPMVFPPPNENPIVKQIDYYFSDENLVKDDFLRSKMDEHGWVPITLIASFPRVKQLTQDIQVILESLRISAIVEVQGGKLRRRNDWSKWIHSPRLNTPALTTDLQQLSLDNSATNANDNVDTREEQTETATSRVLSEELNDQSRSSNGEDTTEDAHSFN